MLNLEMPKIQRKGARAQSFMGLHRLVGHSEFLLHLIAKNTPGHEADDPLWGQKSHQNRDSSVFTPQIYVQPVLFGFLCGSATQRLCVNFLQRGQ